MVELSTIARIVVGLILLWAAAAKLRRRDDLPDWLTAYGLPARYARETAWAVMAAYSERFKGTASPDYWWSLLKLACDAPSRQDPDVRMGLRS